MNVTGRLVTALARTLPGSLRDRYREEWLADLNGARELRLSAWSVVGGAALATLTIDRADPLVSGITTGRLILNRMRWAAAFLGIAAVLGGGSFLWGGFRSGSLAVIGIGFSTVAILCAALGLFAGAGTLIVAVGANARRTALVSAAALVGGAAILVWMVLIPPLGLLVVPAALAFGVVLGSAKLRPVGFRTASPPQRIALALGFTVLVVLAVAAGVLDITVWNPLATLPGQSLDQIYAAMAAANQSPDVAQVVIWAVVWSAASMALPVLVGYPRFAGFFTARRIVVTGLLLIGATTGFQWLAGFDLGMSLADTFMVTGGSHAISSPIIAITGQLALVSAIVIGLMSPRRGLPA